MAMSDVGTEGRSGRKLLLERLPVQEKQLDIGGMSTSVLEGGEGPPMLLLHGGIQAGGLVWWRALPRLVESHRVIVPDLPGLGESEIGTGRLDADLVSGWLEELIRATCRERPTLVAHSAPAAFGAHFAIERSDRLRRLVLLDPGGLRRAGLPPPGLLLSALRSTSRPNERNFHRFMGRVMHDLDRVREEDDRWSAFTRYVLARAALPSVKRTMRHAAKVGLRGAIPEGKLARIAVPVTLIWGRHDQLTPLRIGERLSDRLDWPLRVIERAGHLPHLEQPDAFVDALRASMAAG
jgi:pimeloyl-ACP methyl ester carboxylesterase